MEEKAKSKEPPPPEASKKDGEESASFFQQHSQLGAMPGFEQGWLYAEGYNGWKWLDCLKSSSSFFPFFFCINIYWVPAMWWDNYTRCQWQSAALILASYPWLSLAFSIIMSGMYCRFSTPVPRNPISSLSFLLFPSFYAPNLNLWSNVSTLSGPK